MKKIIFSMIVVLSCGAVLRAAEDNAVRKTPNISFEQLLNAISAEVPDAGAFVPVPAVSPADLRENKDEKYWVIISASDKYQRTRLLEAGVDIVEVLKDKIIGIAHKDVVAALEKKGYVIESKIPFSEYVNKFSKDFPPDDAIYHNYKETTELLNALVPKNADIASLFSIGKTIQGRDIWTLRINSNAQGQSPSAKPGAVFVGNHHAREHLSVEVPLLFAVWLLENRNDREVKKYIDSLDIYIIPMLNPDGAEYDIENGSYRWHRKNMRVNADKTIGVDLNRNYDSWWCKEGSSSNPYADTYCGTAPFSEPETQAMKKFVLARKNLKTMMSYHSYSGLILYPWGGRDTQIENEKDRKVFIKMAQEMASRTEYTPEQSSDLYVATGDTCDWAYEKGRIFAFTTELEGRGFYPGAGIIEKAVKNNVQAAVYMLSVTDNPYRTVQ